jgi:hypothetical protein
MRKPLFIATIFALAVTAGAVGAIAQKPPQEVKLGIVTGKLPGEWTARNPNREFRLAEYVVPKAAGDTAETLMIVFHFGKGGGGGVEDNVKRWIGLMPQADGSDSTAKAKRNTSDRPGLKIHTVDVAGTYQDRPFPRATEATPRPNYRMFASIIETTGEGTDGPYFIRLVGPAKTVAAAKAGWDAFIASLKAQ